MNPIIKNTTMYRIIYLSFIILMVTSWSHAQTIKFQKVYGGYSYDYGNDLIQTADTGYLLLSTTNSFSSSSDIYLLKVDKLGNYEWQHTYGGSEIEGACKIKFTQDGNLAMAGYSSSYLITTYDFYLIKAAVNGDTIWTKHYGTNEWDFAYSMDTCVDGGFILAGKTYDTDNAYSDILIVKTDTNGIQQWQKKIGGNLDDVANSIISVSDGYVICGTSESVGAGKKDIYVVKIDLSGNIVWETTLGGSEDDAGETVVLDTVNDELIIGGNTKSFGIDQYYNFYLQKLSLSGSVLPLSFISTNNSNYYLTELTIRQNGNIMLCGEIDFFNSTDFMLLEYDNNFNFVTGTTYGALFRESPNVIIPTLDGGICAIGSSASFGFGLDNIYLVKCDTLVTNVGNLQNFVSIESIAIDQNQESIVFPNPSNGVFTFKLNNTIKFSDLNTITCELYNSLGQSVQINRPQLKRQNDALYLNFNLPSLLNGNYYLQIHQSGELVDSKIISVLR